ncbi:hypothetical protein AGABI2DRAFT_121982 [Agaricus bisporus var. bisporus H97]|uniref:hypothetical protein n=1 Tax=Agaricus bisporus var. bisporus (strain H97 / ATCC MYA-4626 / FGSC 10389) TaxID=936046 RepID=UPI00029F7D8D|nr:hypothetical protein AGABI2DRAFT_121982 [Agaricus bisporus var. bisporus H97]EKV43087.1 hypothetical protein AGABI2DRAFT_121982 [Agaricus bisporus var. bisporus H97]
MPDKIFGAAVYYPEKINQNLRLLKANLAKLYMYYKQKDHLDATGKMVEIAKVQAANYILYKAQVTESGQGPELENLMPSLAA